MGYAMMAGASLPLASSAIVHLHQGKPVTDSLAIAREFGRRHDNVLQPLDALIASRSRGRLEFKASSCKNEQNKKQRMIELTERGAPVQTSALTWLRGAARQSHAIALAWRRRSDYYSAVPDKEGNGFDRPTTQKRTDRAMRFFYVRMPSCALYERRWWGSLRARWLSFVCRSINPIICRSPRLIAGRGLPHTKEYTMHHHAGSTPAHSHSVITKRSARKAKALLPVAAALVLTKDEIHLVENYRKMNDRLRETTISVCDLWAKNNPRRIAPSLRLVVGGAA
jgi:Rha family phage regulatory protein